MDGFFFGVGLVWLVGLILVIWALVDAIQVPDDSMYQSGNKIVWVLVIVFLNFIGAILYFVIGRPSSGAPRTPTTRSSGSMPPPPPPPPPTE